MPWILFVVLAILVGCASGNCRQVSEQAKQEKMKALEANPALDSKGAAVPEVAPPGPKTALPTDTVQVFKYDGSLQCAMGKAIPIADMQKELKGITVLKAESKADGLMHMAVCGGNTGNANVYTILKKDLAAAKKANFREWTFE